MCYRRYMYFEPKEMLYDVSISADNKPAGRCQLCLKNHVLLLNYYCYYNYD